MNGWGEPAGWGDRSVTGLPVQAPIGSDPPGRALRGAAPNPSTIRTTDTVVIPWPGSDGTQRNTTTSLHRPSVRPATVGPDELLGDAVHVDYRADYGRMVTGERVVTDHALGPHAEVRAEADRAFENPAAVVPFSSSRISAQATQDAHARTVSGSGQPRGHGPSNRVQLPQQRYPVTMQHPPHSRRLETEPASDGHRPRRVDSRIMCIRVSIHSAV